MTQKYNLSSLEWEIMEFIWEQKEGLYFRDLMQHFVKEGGKQWKRQSLRTFLLNLEKKGALEIKKHEKFYMYVPVSTKEGHIRKWTKNMLKEFYNGSLKEFLLALKGDTGLSEQEMSELREFLRDC